MEFKYEENRIYLTDKSGEVIAEVTYVPVKDNIVDINHTFVDDCLRGQGVASKLLEALSTKLREDGLKAYPTCSYAVHWFEKNQDYADLLAE
ncbi:GNAT family N-acetyltransferase [Anaeromicropila herbilytica]|uniref:N-acetyltransferase n=1 Tax=Anaeromicropila herbilytica TaxID=2785025 RepID=A0A7R7ICW4_9FIRM|nr:GNAT family N-acetyltransferase [Anaeromicropila herbilytica]BCN30276.1 N-acetyltransferase [Anaeromicropila herbilytica]